MGAALGAIRQVVVVLAGVVALALLVPGASAAQSTAPGGDAQPGSSDGETQTSTIVWVAPTLDGSPTFLYYSPHEGDRAVVLPEATPLLLVSGEVEGDGQRWYVVHTPDDDEGYILVSATTPVSPTSDAP
jgi:hypothetical protein